jgi:hypothetical protein
MMKPFVPLTAFAVLLSAVCVSAQAKTFKCLSNSRLDCPTETTDFSAPTLSDSTELSTSTFKSKTDGGKGGGNGSSNTGGGGIYTPSKPGIATAVPEPENIAMMALGLGVLAWSLRRRPPA